MNELAKKLFYDHKNPIVKLDSLGSKLFLKTTTKEYNEFNEQNQNIIEDVLRHTRVERRCARAKAEWCPDIGLCKVTKVVKGLLKNFGYQDKTGIFMYPEEMLLLVETNRMEISYKEVPLSLQECYQIILQTETGLRNFLVYKKFVLHGYRLSRYRDVLRRIKKDAKRAIDIEKIEFSNSTKRRFSEESEDFPNKIKGVHQHQHLKDDKDVASHINNISEIIRKNAPKEYSSCSHLEFCPDYCVFLPSNKSRTDWNFSLYICEELLDQPTHKEVPTPIYAACSQDNIFLLRWYNVNLPNLPS